MSGNNEYDALGELFRRRLEYHQIPVDNNGWDEIMRQLGKGKSVVARWLWSAGAMVAAASVAALLIFNWPANDETNVVVVSQQIVTEEMKSTNEETVPTIQKQKMARTEQVDVAKPVEKPTKNNTFTAFQPTDEENQTNTENFVTMLDQNETENPTDSIIQSISHSINQSISQSSLPKLDVSLVEDYPDEDEKATKKTEKWLLTAAFGTGGNSNGHGNESKNVYNDMSMPKGWEGMGSGNNYAVYMSGNIQSFSNMSKDDFTNYRHHPPLSIGLTARKNREKGGVVESGLVYTYLSSDFVWSGHDAHQSLHYVGIPVNLVLYLWNSNPNWRIYLSGGFMVEKGIRAVFRQEKQTSDVHRITTVRSSINGMQWSLNSGFGVICSLEKGWGIYFEPRVGYSFGNNQPVSIRTEYPIYFGVNLGLNFEL